ncbi:MAG: FG-GAP repeat protein, partial [Planctomycetota bacterium]|nr:FG-GAP repeat protein [Planctomycetota bacterium]
MNHAPRSLVSIFTMGICVLGAANGSFAQTACEDTRLAASDSGVFESFGYAVGVWADTALIGAQWDRELGTEAGAAYIFELDRQGQAWVESQKLMASDGAAGNHFGRAAAIDGDTAMITATSHLHDGAGGNGSVYVFDYNGTAWTEQQELIASDGAIGDVFGRSVSISGDVALIGAPGDDDNGSGSGSAYLFRFDPGTSQWIEDTKLTASDAAVADNFGLAVGVSGDTVVIAAPGSDDGCPDGVNCNTGAAYVFRYDPETSRWVEQEKLLASDGAAFDGFGLSVSISGEVALIGAHGDGFSSGSAYVFRFDPENWQWVEEQKLLASDGAVFDQFGRAVAIDGDTAVIGAFDHEDVGPVFGAAYVFRFDPAGSGSWIEQQKLLPNPNPWTNFLGWSVAIDGDTAVIGAYGEDQQAGAAYVFDLTACLCTADLDGDGNVGILDLLALLAAWDTEPG